MQGLEQERDRKAFTSLSSAFPRVRWPICYPCFIRPQGRAIYSSGGFCLSPAWRQVSPETLFHTGSQWVTFFCHLSLCHPTVSLPSSLSAVERVRLDLKLILHPLCPEMDVKNELITIEASVIEASGTFPPNRGWLRQSTLLVSLVTNWPLRFPSCSCRQASQQADWGKGSSSQHPEHALGRMSPTMPFANHLLLQIQASCLCYNWSIDSTTSQV